MSQLIVTIDDKLASEVFSYTAYHHTSFDEMTKKLWIDFLSKQKNTADNSAFLQLLDNTKGIWKHGDGLEFQEKLRAEWE